MMIYCRTMKRKSVRDEVVSKGYLTDELAEFRAGIINQLDGRIESKFKNYTNKVLTGQDKIMKEIQDMREEDAAGTLQMRRLEKTVDSHEKRITRLESPTTT